MKANIFNIQKSGIHGGPGIRTVIFFKGCPLRCPWCSNPESQSPPTQLLWDSKKCFFGHLCELNCPDKSIQFENHALRFNHETCTGCMTCVTQCPTKALEFAGRMMEPDEVMEEIYKDKKICGKDWGGVTLSGGEVLNQPEFAAEILKRCKEQSIHTAVETSGYATPIVFSKVAKNADLLLIHIKHYNNQEHIKYTGVSQGTILSNLDGAIASRVPVTVRISVIPGVNNTPEDANKFAGLLKEHKVTSVNLLPLRQSGEAECKAAGCSPAPDQADALPPEDLRDYYNIFKNAGFDVHI